MFSSVSRVSCLLVSSRSEEKMRFHHDYTTIPEPTVLGPQAKMKTILSKEGTIA